MLKQTKLSKAVAVVLCATFIGGFPLTYAEDEDLTNQLSGVEQQMGEQANKRRMRKQPSAVLMSSYDRFR